MSSKVSVRTDGEGVLSMNFMVEVEGNKNVFVEFRVHHPRSWRVVMVGDA